MDKFLMVIGAAFLVPVTLFSLAILGAIFGGMGGWAIEHTFLADFFVRGMSSLNFEVTPDKIPAIGAVLGFVGGFIRSTASHSKD